MVEFMAGWPSDWLSGSLVVYTRLFLDLNACVFVCINKYIGVYVRLHKTRGTAHMKVLTRNKRCMINLEVHKKNSKLYACMWIELGRHELSNYQMLLLLLLLLLLILRFDCQRWDVQLLTNLFNY